MAMTPYPFSNGYYEAPSNVASNDGAGLFQKVLRTLRVWYGAKKQLDSSWRIGEMQRSFDDFIEAVIKADIPAV